MGCNSRDKSVRGGRKARNTSKLQHQQQPPPSQRQTPGDPVPSRPSTISPTIPGPSEAGSDVASIASDIANPHPLGDYDAAAAAAAAAAAGSGYCTEEQLEDLLLKHLDLVYKEAISKLVSFGYDEDLALRAILRNGHCYGTLDVLANILHNAMAYINSSAASARNSDSDDASSAAAAAAEKSASFSDLRHLQEYSLAGMVCLLQEVRPHLSRGDAMWCLLMSDLHVGRASTIEIPVLPPPFPPISASPSSDETDGGDSVCHSPYGLCRFHGGCNGERELEIPKRFSLSPSIKSFLKRNSAMAAASCGLTSKMSLPAPRTRQDSSGNRNAAASSENQCPQHQSTEEQGPSKESDVVASVLKSLESLSLEEKGNEGAEDPRNEMILNLVNQIRDLEEQVKDRKEWAQQKAMQAARKLSSDMMELKMLRMEKEENQTLKKGKQALEDTTMKRLSEMENALRKASGQVDRANAAVRQLEAENAEIRAEMEAAKLSKAESDKACLEIVRREKKYLKKLLAWEKQKEKMEAEIADVRKNVVQIRQKLNQVNEAKNEMEVKLREEIKAKDQAAVLLEEERRAKEAAEASIKRKHEALRQKIEIDFQRHKDDIRRLEEELTRLKPLSPPVSTDFICSKVSPPGNSNGRKSLNAASGKTNHLPKQQESAQKKVNHDRECLICMKDEVSVVFLPCAHQVLCANCNENHEKKAIACPCCNVHIDQRVRVYGASS